jgi:hypothetical protein
MQSSTNSLGVKRRRRREEGYVLLILILMMAMIAIFAAMIVPSVEFQIKRDREEELIHRGVQYTRAIRAYYKKLGRYPTKIEDLESANNLRYLRKRYKDPMNCVKGVCQDFKFLHMGEAKLTLGGALGGSMIPGTNPLGGAPNGLSPGGLNPGGGLSQPSAFGGTSAFGGGSSSFGSSGGAGGLNSPYGQTPQNAPGQTGATGSTSGSDPSQTSSTSTPGDPAQPGQGGATSGPGANFNNSGSPLNGGAIGSPILGVASNVKCPPAKIDRCEGYREFDHKKKYADWQFVFDPAAGGSLPTTPNQQPLQGAIQNVNGTPANGQPSNGLGGGLSSPSTGMQNTNPGGGFGTSSPNPAPPSNPPQQ